MALRPSYGFGQLVAGPLAGIPAVILGHQARRRIRLTGERGDGLAVTGLILGYIGVGLILLVVLAFLLLGSRQLRAAEQARRPETARSRSQRF